MECVTCGGTEFYKESGYFYCSECQVQSQEIREHVFQEEANNVNQKRLRKIKSKSDNTDTNITSWECYNIVMVSLTQQLISLGADQSLKPIVKYLWIRYLEKLEVINIKYDDRPKLPLVNWKRDANVLYKQTQPKKKQKRKKSTSDESSTTMDIVSLKRARSRKKRALAQAQYDEISQNQDSTTLHSETLTSLKSGSETSTKRERPISFNRYSIKELRRKMSKRHCRRHKFDAERKLKCHKFTYVNCSNQYIKGIKFVSPIKLYCILYLGLLINKDKIQLGDLLRFIKEGHLNFNRYTELLPAEYLNKSINIRNNNRNSLFLSKNFRIVTAKLAKFLDVVRYIEVIDMVELTQRFCKELNLPDEIFLVAKNLISKTAPKLIFTNKDTIIPNYEGRAMGIIIFALKLFFGLDGITEFELSRYAQLVNRVQKDVPKMFDVVKWMKYIGYRSLILSECHFPTFYEESSNNVNSNLFLRYVDSNIFTQEGTIKFTKEMNDYRQILTNIQELEGNENPRVEFPVSFTPFLDYSKILSKNIKYDKDNLLTENFKDDNLDFLLRPNKYLLLVGEHINIKHGGANDNWVLEKIKSYRTECLANRRDSKLCPVEIVQKGLEKDVNYILENPIPPKNPNSLHIQSDYEKYRQHIFHENEKYIERISKEVVFDEIDTESLGCYNNHFNPYERYWLYLQMNIDMLNKKIRVDFFEKHSNSFKLIFKECARVIEQTVQELLYDFQFCELFLVFAAKYKHKCEKSKAIKLMDVNLQHYITQAEIYW